MLFPGDPLPSRGYPIDRIVRQLEKEGYLQLVCGQTLPQHNGRQAYGMFTVHPENRILMHKSLQFWGPRFVSSLAHEIGHFVLHRRYLSPQTFISTEQPALIPTDRKRFGRMARFSDLDWVEWEANEFMLHTILPPAELWLRIAAVKEELGLRPGRIWIDDQDCTQNDADRIFCRIATSVMTRIDFVERRARFLGFVNDVRSPQAQTKTAGEILLGSESAG